MRGDLDVDDGAVLAQMAVARVAHDLARAPQHLAKRRPLLVQPQIVETHGEELLARIAVALERRLVDRQEAQRSRLVDPHRLHVGIEEQPVLALALFQFLERALALDGPRHLIGDEAEDVLLRLAVAAGLGVGLRRQDSEDAAPAAQRNAQPVDAFAPHQVHVAPRDHGAEHLGGREQRLARAQDPGGEPVPHLFRRRLRLLFVDEVGEADHLRRRIVEGDVEILRLHQPHDDLVQREVERGQAGRVAGRFGDPVERGLDALGANAGADVAEAPHPPDDPALDVLRLRVALEDAAVLEGQHIEALRVRIGVELLHLLDEAVGIAQLREHVRDGQRVVARVEDLPREAPLPGELAVVGEDLAAVIDHQDAVGGGFQRGREERECVAVNDQTPSSLCGMTVSSSGNSLPSRRRPSNSTRRRMTGPWPVARNSCSPRRCAARQRSGMMVSAMLRPSASAADQPKSVSASALQRVSLPAASISTTASGAAATMCKPSLPGAKSIPPFRSPPKD